MPDGTVVNGGGGLCGNCATNHFDAQVYSPPYLFKGERPVIEDVSAGEVPTGGSLTISTSGPAVVGFSLIRLGSTTHTVNTDQRRIALVPEEVEGGWRVTVPADSGVALPGYWYLFALTEGGVPSVAKFVKVTRG